MEAEPIESQVQTLQKEIQRMRSSLDGMADAIAAQKNAEAERAKSDSLLHAMLESTRDGILIVDSSGKISAYNNKFVQMWRIPESLITAKDDDQILLFVLDQLADPDGFLSRVRELYRSPSMQSTDLIEFKDGRFFERYTRPQRVDGNRIVGRVWSFRDVTEQKKAENTVRDQNEKLALLTRTTAALLSSIDLGEMLGTVKRILVPRIADSYALHLVRESDGAIRCLDFFHDDSVINEAAHSANGDTKFIPNAVTGIPSVIRSGKPELYSETSETILKEAFPSVVYWEILKTMKIYSLMQIPLSIRGKTFGAVSLLSTSEDRHFTWDDLRLAESISYRISFSLDNALMSRKLESIRQKTFKEPLRKTISTLGRESTNLTRDAIRIALLRSGRKKLNLWHGDLLDKLRMLAPDGDLEITGSKPIPGAWDEDVLRKIFRYLKPSKIEVRAEGAKVRLRVRSSAKAPIFSRFTGRAARLFLKEQARLLKGEAHQGDQPGVTNLEFPMG